MYTQRIPSDTLQHKENRKQNKQQCTCQKGGKLV